MPQAVTMAIYYERQQFTARCPNGNKHNPASHLPRVGNCICSRPYTVLEIVRLAPLTHEDFYIY